MFHYQFEDLKTTLAAILRQNVSTETWGWLEEKASSLTPQHFNAAFAMMPRKTGKALIHLSAEQNRAIQMARPGLSLQGWTTDRLARVWLLLQLEATNQESYFRTIENLFLAAEMHELVALYSALPVLAYPEIWTRRCAEGIRSNIGDVLSIRTVGRSGLEPVGAESLFYRKTHSPDHWVGQPRQPGVGPHSLRLCTRTLGCASYGFSAVVALCGPVHQRTDFSGHRTALSFGKHSR